MTERLVEPAFMTPPPDFVPGAWFDVEAVEHVLKFFQKLRHIEGRYAGQPVVPMDWQIEYVIAPVFGWKHPRTIEHPRGLRIIRDVYLEVPKKNAKSTLSSGLGLYLWCADREVGSQVYAAAGDKLQAGVVHGIAKEMVKRSPALRKLQDSEKIRPLKDILEFNGKLGLNIFRVLSSKADLKQGVNAQGVVVDEVYVIEKRDLVDNLETSTASREQPLVIKITTAGIYKPESIAWENHERVEKIARGALAPDPTFHGVIYCADKDKDNPFDERTWEKANPSLDITVQRDYLRAKAQKAEQSPAFLNTFLRLHLNIWTQQLVRWMPVEKWDRARIFLDKDGNERMFYPPTRERLHGMTAYGGLDLASSIDIAAWNLTFPMDEGEWYQALWRFWIPEDRVQDLSGRTHGASDVWIRDGHLEVTPGDVIDYDRIMARVDEDAMDFDIMSIGYDRWGMTQLSQMLQDLGMVVEPVRQGFGLSPAIKEWERLIYRNRYNHGGNPVMRWMIDNVVAKVDGHGNVMLDKEKSPDKIDGAIGAVMGLDLAIRDLGGYTAEVVSA